MAFERLRLVLSHCLSKQYHRPLCWVFSYRKLLTLRGITMLPLKRRKWSSRETVSELIWGRKRQSRGSGYLLEED